jgi:hypothetical protein
MGKKGYITVNIDVSETVYIDEVIDQIDDDILIDEIKERKLQSKLIDVMKPKIDYNSICDLLGVNYHTPLKYVMKQLEQHLNS